MKYQQLTSNDRYILAALRRQGITISAIAEELGKHRSTVYRELNRTAAIK
jgi:IS30 family transposase